MKMLRANGGGESISRDSPQNKGPLLFEFPKPSISCQYSLGSPLDCCYGRTLNPNLKILNPSLKALNPNP